MATALGKVGLCRSKANGAVSQAVDLSLWQKLAPFVAWGVAVVVSRVELQMEAQLPWSFARLICQGATGEDLMVIVPKQEKWASTAVGTLSG
mmetsp:Transcript_7056/g.13040  ORF Transcript_7056/g.13040 Transcript_7056/m.13040 type:complete len:92 (+) Transcript_7056:86-361(+)